MNLTTVTAGEMLGYVFPILFGLIIGIIACLVTKSFLIWRRNKKMPVTSAKAVIRKIKKHNYGSRTDRFCYIASFELEGGGKVELAIPEDAGKGLVKHQSGTLTRRGTRFMSFK